MFVPGHKDSLAGASRAAGGILRGKAARVREAGHASKGEFCIELCCAFVIVVDFWYLVTVAPVQNEPVIEQVG